MPRHGRRGKRRAGQSGIEPSDAKMSGPGDDRWRGGRAHDQNRQAGQRQSGSFRDRSSIGPQQQDRQGHRGQGHGNQNPSGAWGGRPESDRDSSPAVPAQEKHVPVSGFNATECKDTLKRPYQSAGSKSHAVYKAPGKETNNRSGSPWGSKPNNMANGKDFFLELRKQVTLLQQNGTIPGG